MRLAAVRRQRGLDARAAGESGGADEPCRNQRPSAALAGIVQWRDGKAGTAMSLRRDLAVLREPGFYLAALLAIVLTGGVLLFCGLNAP
jgi:hypothetical protein